MKYQVPQLIPYVGDEELENLKLVIERKWITEGPFSKEFLDLIKEKTKAKYAVLANNGTLALFIALKAIGIGKGDEVIVPNLTFIASATSVYFAGAKPVFVDVDNSSLNIDVSKIEQLITAKTKAIMPVHLYGQSADMDPILAIAKKHNIKIIEDAAQGFGVYYKGRHTGTIGDVGTISFFADKTITTGEGAVVLTNDEKTYETLKLIRNQGRPNSGTFIHPFLGMNFRMTDLQCAVGVAQIKKFDEIVRIKKANFDLYYSKLKDIDELSFVDEMEYSNFVPFRVNIKVKKQPELINYLESNGIQTRGFFYPLHRQPCFSYLEYESDEFEVSNRLNQTGLSLPIYPGLKEEQIMYVVNAIVSFYKNK